MSAQRVVMLFAILTFFPPTSGLPRCRFNAAIYNFKLGKMRGTIVSDGPTIVADNPFFVPDLAVTRSYSTAFRSSKPIVFAQNVAVLDVPDIGRVLVDTGSLGYQDVPFFRKSGLLFANLQAAAIDPASIDVVLITHGHIDHVSGLRASDGSPAFPNARVYISRTEHEFWMDPFRNPNSTQLPDDQLAMSAQIYQQGIEPYVGKGLELVDDDGSPLPGVRYIFGPGHSPGHSAIEITVGEARLVISGDTWISRPDQLQNPEWRFFSESNTTRAYLSRLQLLSLAASRRDLVLSYHEQFPGLGFIAQSGHLFDWVPAPAERLGTAVALQC